MHDSYPDTITISQADSLLLPQIKRFFKEHGFRAQAAKSDIIYIIKKNKLLLGALRLCPYEDSWLLRSMCIKEAHRNKGLGHYMLSTLSEELREKQCYCFPYDYLESFYSDTGFTKISSDLADPTISDLYNNYIQQGKRIILMQHIAAN